MYVYIYISYIIQTILPSNETILLFAVCFVWLGKSIRLTLIMFYFKQVLTLYKQLTLYEESICFVPESLWKNQFQCKKKYKITQE